MFCFIQTDAHQNEISFVSTFFVKTDWATPKENHRRTEHWLCYSIETLLQSALSQQCRQITDGESYREGGNQNKKPKEMVMSIAYPVGIIENFLCVQTVIAENISRPWVVIRGSERHFDFL